MNVRLFLILSGGWFLSAAPFATPSATAAPAATGRPTAGTPAVTASAPAAPAASSAPGTAVLPPGVAAQVNADRIMKADVERMVASIRDSEPALATGTAAAQAALQVWRGRILDNMITEKLLYQEAQRRRISAPAGEVDKAFAGFKDGLGVKTDEEFRQLMAKEGITPAYVRQGIEENLAIQALTRQLTADVTVTDADIQKFYKDNPLRFTVPEAAQVSHILLAVPRDATPAQRQKTRQKAENVLRQARGSADFTGLALANSDDPGSKQKGGDLGWITREDYDKAVTEAIFTAPVGKVAPQLVETDFGYHILLVRGKTTARVVPLSEEIRKELRKVLLPTKIKDRLEKEVAGLRAKATIRRAF